MFATSACPTYKSAPSGRRHDMYQQTTIGRANEGVTQQASLEHLLIVSRRPGSRLHAAADLSTCQHCFHTTRHRDRLINEVTESALVPSPRGAQVVPPLLETSSKPCCSIRETYVAFACDYAKAELYQRSSCHHLKRLNELFSVPFSGARSLLPPPTFNGIATSASATAEHRARRTGAMLCARMQNSRRNAIALAALLLLIACLCIEDASAARFPAALVTSEGAASEPRIGGGSLCRANYLQICHGSVFCTPNDRL